jgi:hypothetical protein
MIRYKKCINTLILWMLALFLCGRVRAQTSTLVYADSGGSLVYGTYANQGQTNAVNSVPDWSGCGYKGGGVPIPFVPAAITITAPTGGDDTALIQNAINTVSAMPLGTNGFRGAVLIKAGQYQVDSTLEIRASGVVIRGEGQDTHGTVLTMTATVQDNLFDAKGTGWYPSWSSTVILTETFVPSGRKWFAVSSASAYSPGDQIRIVYKMNQQWIDDIGMDAIIDPVEGDESWLPADFQLTYDRIVTAVTNNTIYMDAPLVQSIEAQYGGAEVSKLGASIGRISNVGFESLRLKSTYTNETDEAHGWRAIWMGDIENAWVRQVTAQYFGGSAVMMSLRSRNITVEDCAMLDPKSIITGERRYSFYVVRGSSMLVQRCYTREGRHDYVSGTLTPGPNAFVDSLAENAYEDIGPHMKYATGELYDNIKGGTIKVQNRWDWGGGHGWSGGQIMFWNCDGSGIICDTPVGAMNWAIGCAGPHVEGNQVPSDPDGFWESHNTRITPRSLYYRQLEARAGKDAVRNIMIPQQENGTLWSALSNWKGDALFGDEVVAWVSDSSILPPTNTVNLAGKVRNLQMLEHGVTSVWTHVSGPGLVFFDDSTALNTTAAFSTTGVYVVRLTVGDGFKTASNEVQLIYGDLAPVVNLGGVRSEQPRSATLSGSLSVTPADVYVVWDTEDKGTNLLSWGASRLFPAQAMGAFDVFVTNLYCGVHYTWRIFATNAAGSAWSPATHFLTALPRTDYVSVEDFEARTVDAAIAWQGTWVSDSTATNEFSVRLDPSDPGNQVLWFNQGSGREASFTFYDQRIAAGTNGTFFFRMRGESMDSNSVLRIRQNICDKADPAPYSVNVGPETEFYDNSFQSLRFVNASPIAQTNWYRVWFVIDNAAKTFDIYLKREGGSQILAQAGKTFRNSNQTGDLYSFMLYTLAGGSNGDAWFDDFLVLPGKDAHDIDPLSPPAFFSIENASASDVTATAAELNGSVLAIDSVMTVHAYWSTNNHATPAAWLEDGTAGSAVVGIFTNPATLSVSVIANALSQGTTYYYTLLAANAVTNLWAAPSVSFTTSVAHIPSASAGEDRSVELDQRAPGTSITTISLAGSVDVASTGVWSQISGPAAVAFADASAPDTTATFYNAGTYVLRLTAGDGNTTTHDEVVITVIDSYAVPFFEPFEARTLGDLNDQYGWVADGTVVQNTNTFNSSAKAAQISGGGGYLRHLFTDNRTKAWTDMRLQVVYSAEPPVPDTNSTVMVYVSTTAMVMAFNGTNVVSTGLSVTNPLAWVRFTTFSDYAAKTYVLYVDDVRAGKYGFYNTNVANFTELKISGEATFVDDVGVTPHQPIMRYMPSLILLQ